MSGDETYDAPALRAEIARAAQAGSLVDRAFEVVAIVESVAAPLGIHPVVVGGMAVYFWTASDEFVTYDIDVVMETPDELSERLAELGFLRTADGRHWTLEGTDIFLEAPGSRLDADAVVSEIKLQSGRTATVISRVECLSTVWMSSRRPDMRRPRSKPSRSSQVCLKKRRKISIVAHPTAV